MQSVPGRSTGFRVGIIGPMSPERNRVVRQVPVDQHIQAIGQGIDVIGRRIKDSIDGVVLEHFSAVNVNEQVIKGAIPDAVFGFLDRADLVIADISHSSPNTMYEIAYVHALGTPVIYLNYSGTTIESVPFYLRHLNITYIDDFEVGEISAKLEPIVLSYMKRPLLDYEAGNVITSYFGVPMVDASAALGVAMGYFSNFIRHVAEENQGVVQLHEDTLDQIIIIRPETFNDAATFMRRVREIPRTESRTYSAPTHPRRELTATVLDRYIVDFPTPITSLKMSPRYKRAFNSMVRDHDTDEAMLLAFEKRMIGSFFRCLAVAMNDQAGINPNYVRIMGADEFWRDIAHAPHDSGAQSRSGGEASDESADPSDDDRPSDENE